MAKLQATLTAPAQALVAKLQAALATPAPAQALVAKLQAALAAPATALSTNLQTALAGTFDIGLETALTGRLEATTLIAAPATIATHRLSEQPTILEMLLTKATLIRVRSRWKSITRSSTMTDLEKAGADLQTYNSLPS